MQRESQFAVWEMVPPLWIQVHLVCPGYFLHGAAAKGMLGYVVFWAPQLVALGGEGTTYPEVPRVRGAEGRRGVGPPAELGVGAWRPRCPRPWASVRVAWSGPCTSEEAADARVPAPAPARLAAHHGLHPEPPHRGRGGHRHPGELGLSLPPEVR